MANETAAQGIETLGALIAQAISARARANRSGDAESILAALERAEEGRAKRQLSEEDFLREALARGSADPASPLAEIDPEEVAEGNIRRPNFIQKLLGQRDINVGPDLLPEDAISQISKIFPGDDVADRFAREGFGKRIERVRVESGIESIRPQLAGALGVNEDQINPESLDILFKLVSALPKSSTASPFSSPIELTDKASGKAVVVQKSNRTGELVINEKFGPKKRASPIPQLTLDFTEEGTLSGLTLGPEDEVKFGPGERAKRAALGAEAGKVQVLKPIVISAVEQLARLDELIPEGTVRGLSADALTGIESAFTQMGALFGGDPKVLTAKFPKRLKDAPEISARVKSGIVNLLALRLQVRGQKPSVRGVEAELRNLDSLSGGNPDAVFAQLQEIAREMIVTFNNRAANAGVDPVGAAQLPGAGRLGIQFPEALDDGGTTVQPGTGAEGGGLRARRGPNGEVILLNPAEREAFDNKGTIPPRFLGGEGGR